MEDIEKKLENLQSSIEAIFLPKGFKVDLKQTTEQWKPLNCELILHGVTKTGEHGYTFIRFDISTMIVAYVQGNKIIYEWLIDKYFIRPSGHDYTDYYDSMYS